MSQRQELLDLLFEADRRQDPRAHQIANQLREPMSVTESMGLLPEFYQVAGESFSQLPDTFKSAENIVNTIYQDGDLEGLARTEKEVRSVLDGLKRKGYMPNTKMHLPWGDTTVKEFVTSASGVGPSVSTTTLGLSGYLFRKRGLGFLTSGGAGATGANITSTNLIADLARQTKDLGYTKQESIDLVDKVKTDINQAALGEAGTEFVGSLGMGNLLRSSLVKHLGEEAADTLLKKVILRASKVGGYATVGTGEEIFEEGGASSIERQQRLDIEQQIPGVDLGGAPYSTEGFVQGMEEATTPVILGGAPIFAGFGGVSQLQHEDMLRRLEEGKPPRESLGRRMMPAPVVAGYDKTKEFLGETVGETLGFKSVEVLRKEQDRALGILTDLQDQVTELEAQGDENKAKSQAIEVDKLRRYIDYIEDNIQIHQAPENLSGVPKVRDTLKGLQQIKYGELIQPAEDALAVLKSYKPFMGEMGGKLSPEINDALLDWLRGNPQKLNNLASQDVTNAAQTIRQVLDQAYEMVASKDITDEELRLSIGKRKDYLTQVFDKEYLRTKEGREAGVRGIMKAGQRNREEALKEGVGAKKANEFLTNRAEAEVLIDSILSQGGVNMIMKPLSSRQLRAKGLKTSPRAWEKKRRFNIEDFDDPKVFESNVEKILREYLYSVSKRSASIESFGAGGGLLENVVNEMQKIMQPHGGTPKKVIDRIYDLADASQQQYKPIESQTGRTVNRMVQTATAMTTLPLATITSITEVAWTIERFGLGNVIKALPMTAEYAARGLQKTIVGAVTDKNSNIIHADGKKMLRATGYGTEAANHERFNQLFAGDMAPILDLWFRSPGSGFLQQWTNTVRVMSGGAGQVMLTKWAEDYINGRDMKYISRRLDELGISEETLVELYNKAPIDNITGSRLIDLSNDAYRQTQILSARETPTGPSTVAQVLGPVLQTMIDDVVMNPQAGNRPLWMSDPHFALIAQLKSFPIVFGNTVMKRIARKIGTAECGGDRRVPMALNTILGMSMAFSLAALSNVIKDIINGRVPEIEDDKDLLKVVDDTGVTGAFSMGLGIFTGGRYGDPVTPLMGPAIGTGADIIIEGVSDSGDLMELMKEKIIRTGGPLAIYFTNED